MSNQTVPPPSDSEVALANIRQLLASADQDKLYLVRTRFNGLMNAYKTNPEALSMLHLLMAEYTTQVRIQREREVQQQQSEAH